MWDNESVPNVDDLVLYVLRSRGAGRCTFGELKSFCAACGLNGAGQEGFEDALKRARIADEQAAASREYLTRIMVELDSVTKNLTACQELNTKQVLEIRELRAKNEELETKLNQAKLPPVEGTIFEDRDRWKTKATNAESKYDAIVKAVVGSIEWNVLKVCDGVVIHHTTVKGYHSEIRSSSVDWNIGVKWDMGVWVSGDDTPVKLVDYCLSDNLDMLKKRAEDAITKAIIEGLCSST